LSDGPNKLSQFWQELKRRRVVHVITVYADEALRPRVRERIKQDLKLIYETGERVTSS